MGKVSQWRATLKGKISKQILCCLWFHFLDNYQSMMPSSSTCKEVAISLVCLFLFPICNGEGGLKYVPSQELCQNISTGACAQELAIIGNLSENILPNCGDLPEGMYSMYVLPIVQKVLCH